MTSLKKCASWFVALVVDLWLVPMHAVYMRKEQGTMYAVVREEMQ